MNIKNALQVILFAMSVLFVGACKDAWDEHNELLSNDGKVTLLEKIADEPSLSKFYAYLQQSGLDKTLSSSKTFTVWAPDNDAMAAISSSVNLTDSATLRQFVEYHISNLTYSSNNKSLLRIQTLNGLSISFDGTRFEESTVTKADLLAKNGVLHIINAAVPVKASVFDVAKGVTSSSLQLSEMKALDTSVVNVDTVKRSPAWKSIVNLLSSKDSLSTYFVLSNTAYQNELNRIAPFYKSSRTRPDSTQSYLTKITMLKNLTVRGVYMPEQLPDTLVSIDGVKIPIKKSAIISTLRANNGIVYVMSELSYRLKDRIREFSIEGENPVPNTSTTSSFSRSDKRSNTFYRSKVDSLGKTFFDIEIYNHGTSGFYINYMKPEVNTATYNVYARAVSGTIGDSQNTVFTQRFGVPNATSPFNTDIILTHTVPVNRYAEVYLGQYTVPQYGPFKLRLVSAASTTAGVNTLILDYVRFVPVLPN